MTDTRWKTFTPKTHGEAWVHPSAQLVGDVEVGAETSVWPTAVLRGDSGSIRVGARTSIQDGCVLHATTDVSHTTVGDECTVGHKAILHGCTVGNRCLIGMGSIILDNAVVPDGCFVAAGSLIPPNRKFEPGSFIIGAPAKSTRKVTEKETAWIESSWKIYVGLMKDYRDAK